MRAIREPQPTLLNSGASAAALPYAAQPARASQWTFHPPASVTRQTRAPATYVSRPVVGNLTLAIYHLDNCEWAQKIAQKNRVPFTSPVEAQTAGYRPCQVCFQRRTT